MKPNPFFSSIKHLVHKHHLIIIFCLALFVRLLCVGLLHNQPLRWDEPYYDLLAHRIIDGYGFSFPSDAYYTGVAHHPISFQEPVYPLFVTLVYTIFEQGSSTTAVYVLQAFIGSFTVLIMFQIGKHVFGLWAGLTAAVLATFYPPLVFFGHLLMTDTLFIFLLISIIYLTLSSSSYSINWRDVIVGLLLGLGVLTRSEMLPVLAIVLLYQLIVTWRLSGMISILLVRSIIIIGIVTLVIAPWTIRNYYVHHTFIPVSTKLGYNLYYYNYPLDDYRFNERVVPFPDVSGLSEPEREKLLRSEAIHFIKSSPATFIKYASLKFADFWRPWPSECNSGLAERIVALLSFVPVSTMGLVGSYLAARSKKVVSQNFAILSMVLLGLWVTKAMVFTGGFKARIAIEPTLVIFASYTMVYLIEALKTKGYIKLGKKFVTNHPHPSNPVSPVGDTSAGHRRGI